MQEPNIPTEAVTLYWYECEQAMYVGSRRSIECMRMGIDDRHHYSRHPSREDHMEGAGAEKATARYLNLDWTASINTFHRKTDQDEDPPADVGRAVEVRWRRDEGDSHPLDLIVRKDDPDDRIYVLVVGAMPTYELVGSITGTRAKQDQWYKNPGGHRPAWFVPQSALKPIRQLKISKVLTEE